MKIALAAILLAMAGPAFADDLAPICPDRPGKGTSPCTLATGHAQIEAGLFDESTQRRDSVTTDAGNAGSLLAKFGVSGNLDLEAGMALYQFQRVNDGGAVTRQEGVGDLSLHAKWNPLEDGGRLAFVLDPYLKLPTAGHGLGNGAVEGGLAAPISYDLGGGWSLAATPEADLLRDAAGDGYHANLANVVGLSRAFGPLTLGAEVWGDQNLDPAGAVAQYSADADAALLVGNDTQLDCGVNLGLNRATPDAEFYFGVSRRF
jgi:hypothetical protein